MQWLSAQGRPAPVAAGLFALATGGALADALAGGQVIDTPLVVLTAAAAGFLTGAWVSPVAASIVCLAGAAMLTAANQVADAGEYSVPNDLFFFAVLLGGTTLAGAVLGARHTQVRELRRLTTIRQQQHAARVRATRLEERNRIAAGVVESLAQRLGAVVVQSSGAARDPAGAQTPDALRRIESTAREALAELREVVGSLREPEPPAQPTGAVAEAIPPPAAPTTTWVDLLAGCSGLPLAFEAVVSSVARGPVGANVVAGIVLGLPLVARRRRPLVAVLLVAVVASLMSAWLTPLPMTVSVLLPLSLAAYSLGSYVRGWRRLAGVAVLLAGIASSVVVSPRGSADPSGVAPTLLWLALALVAGIVAEQHARRAVELRHLLEGIEAGQRHELRLAVAEQRTRTARELHDSVAHAMTVVCLQAEAAQRRPADDTSRRTCIATIEATARGTLDELRHGLVELATDRRREVTGRELAEQVATMSASLGVEVEIRFSPEEMAVPGRTAEVLRRLVREALVNVARHAPTARAWVRCTAAPAGLDVEVVDEGSLGHGVDYGTGTGLRGLAELVGTVGGVLEHGRAGTGFRLAAHLPCDVRALV